MTRRVVSSSPRKVGTSGFVSGLTALTLLSGCYGNKTADEELDDFVIRPNAPDAGTVADAGPADAGRADTGAPSRCTATDPIGLLLCSLAPTGNTGTGNTGNTGTLDLAGILDSLGGLENILDLLGGLSGGGNGNTRMPDAINAAGGLGDLATLLNGVLGGNSDDPLAALLAAFTQGGGNAQPSLADLLTALGAPGANTASTMPRGRGTANNALTTMPTASQCESDKTPATQFLCMLQQTRGTAR